MSNGKAAFYRLAREWHGYLSALAFAALIFFAGTGITLNHPEWFAHARSAHETAIFQLSPDALHRASASRDEAKTLAQMVAASTSVRGAFSSSDIEGGQALLRFEGVSGSSDVSIDLNTGAGEVDTTRSDFVSMLNDLHRGKNAGAAWKTTIDVVAVIVLALSLIGFVLFLSLRLRLVTSLTLVGLGAITLAVLALLCAP
jgi:hypothetical protein